MHIVSEGIEQVTVVSQVNCHSYSGFQSGQLTKHGTTGHHSYGATFIQLCSRCCENTKNIYACERLYIFTTCAEGAGDYKQKEVGLAHVDKCWPLLRYSIWEWTSTRPEATQQTCCVLHLLQISTAIATDPDTDLIHSFINH